MSALGINSALPKVLEQFRSAVEQGENALARGLLQTLLHDFGQHSDTWLAASHFYERIHQPTQALLAIQKALHLQTNDPRLQLRLIECLILRGERIQALHHAKVLIQGIRQEPELLSQLALLFSKLQDYRSAANLYQAAVQIAPEEATLRYNLATMLRITGELKAAERQLDQAIFLNPSDAEAWHLRSGLCRQSAQSNHVAELKHQLSQPALNAKTEVLLRYALAKELEDLNDYEPSFAALKQGADLFRASFQYDVHQDLDILGEIRRTFSSDFFSEAVASVTDTAQPIFVVCMPRAGSTLLERILGCSPDVHLPGELTNFAQCVQSQLRQQFPDWQPANKCDRVRKSRELDFACLGKQYLESTLPYIEHKRHFIDKMPLNFLYIGLIRRALPEAKIIHVRRDPMDHCYAIYKQLFNNAYPFSYRLDELAQYFLAYQQLMQHWHLQLPKVIHQVQYEELVSDPQSSARALYDYCELDWQPHCLDFHRRNEQPSGTASASQVRQPLYTTSVGRWRCYADQLAPLQQWLQFPRGAWILSHLAGFPGSFRSCSPPSCQSSADGRETQHCHR